MKRYFLLRYSFQSSLGGYDEELDIVSSSRNRRSLIKIVQEVLEDKDIELINDYEPNEYIFDESTSMWRIDYEACGMCMRDSVTYKIVEKIC